MSSSIAAQSEDNSLLAHWALVKMDEYNQKFCIFIFLSFSPTLYYFRNITNDVKKQTKKKKRSGKNKEFRGILKDGSFTRLPLIILARL